MFYSMGLFGIALPCWNVRPHNLDGLTASNSILPESRYTFPVTARMIDGGENGAELGEQKLQKSRPLTLTRQELPLTRKPRFTFMTPFLDRSRLQLGLKLQS